MFSIIMFDVDLRVFLKFNNYYVESFWNRWELDIDISFESFCES